MARIRWTAAVCWGLGLMAWAAAWPAQAQWGRLPSGGWPGGLSLPAPVPPLPGPAGPLTERLEKAGAALPAELSALPRRERMQRLQALHPERLAQDPAGHWVRRTELLWDTRQAQATQAALALGFTRLRQVQLPELEIEQGVWAPPAGLGLNEAVQRLQALDPEASVEYQHLYQASAAAPGGAEPPPAVPNRGGEPLDGPARLGLIDGGVAALSASWAPQQRWGCDGRVVPSAHGTAVASLAPGVRLWAADVYCGRPDGGAAEEVAQALAWMVREQVPVVNISLVGPPNRLLELAVQAAVRRGHVLVAAVGNDGPSAAPLYPAAYALRWPAVVGVTGFGPQQRVLPEAVRGPQVVFASWGQVVAASPTGERVAVRGTSFAAPQVAAGLAKQLRRPHPDEALRVVQAAQAQAQDLGDPGRDPVYGWGWWPPRPAAQPAP